MKNKIIVTIILFFICNSYSFSQDIRQNMQNIDEQRRYILKRSLLELKSAEQDYKKTIEAIKNNRKLLLDKIAELKNKKQQLLSESKTLKQEIQKLDKENEVLSSIFEKNTSDIKELVGLIRINAKDLESILKQSPYSALKRHREKKLSSILNKTDFPDMKDLKEMADLLFEEILNNSEVTLKKGLFVDRKGMEKSADILFIGPFTQIYREGKEVGFLLYSDNSERFFALSKPAPYLVRRDIKKYLEGKTPLAPVDISKGGAIREFLYKLSLWENILMGGPLVWPILAIGVIALILILERFYTLRKKYIDAEQFMDKLKRLINEKKWDDAESLCKEFKSKSIPKVILKGVLNRNLPREEMENILQEEILKEIPRLERFLSTLGMLAKIAPLLGLLGTVTGMINTFQVITYFGTSDPKLMASGISEALVTTMLGLSVAIPIMFFHTILNRKVENYISDMEENCISFVNLLYAK